jgi:hypothetical protein
MGLSEEYEVEIEDLPNGHRRACCPICKIPLPERWTAAGVMDEVVGHMNLEHDGGERTGRA